MRIQAGQTVLLTGASGGLGTHLTAAFSALKMNVALVAYPGNDLEKLREEVQKCGGKAIGLNSDLRDSEERRHVVERVRNELGEIDILVNNAGVEFTSPYHELTEQNIVDVLGVNLVAAMVMTWLVLPQMLMRGRGHIVNISSLAGRANPALQEPYSASKAGLIAFTYSLRASYRRQGVSASAIIPGFVETGIYARLKERSGYSAPALLGTSDPQKVIEAVTRSIQRDLPEIIVNPLPVRPLLAVLSLFPSLGEWALAKTGGHDFFRKVFEASKTRDGQFAGSNDHTAVSSRNPQLPDAS
jgi:short-subunit dehydrogenase